MIDWSDLKQYVGAHQEDDDDYVKSCFNMSTELIDTATLRAFRPVPVAVKDRMILEVGAELYNRKSSPSGNSQLVMYEGGSIPVRGPRDPLAQIRPILAMYVVRI